MTIVNGESQCVENLGLSACQQTICTRSDLSARLVTSSYLDLKHHQQITKDNHSTILLALPLQRYGIALRATSLHRHSQQPLTTLHHRPRLS
ncbi:hypothetical protein M758_UG171200 [Ceratodon purpureus]|nr:hypothetical protein M758_UG171200 [Ceratodon purpureus]